MSGKVTFPDGEPLDCGIVVFDNGQKHFRGGIKPDGSFNIGTSSTSKDGLLPGKYRVCIQGAVRLQKPDTATGKTVTGKTLSGEALQMSASMSTKSTPLIPSRYNDVKTSGLEVVVDRKTKVFDIQVERP